MRRSGAGTKFRTATNYLRARLAGLSLQTGPFKISQIQKQRPPKGRPLQPGLFKISQIQSQRPKPYVAACAFQKFSDTKTTAPISSGGPGAGRRASGAAGQKSLTNLCVESVTSRPHFAVRRPQGPLESERGRETGFSGFLPRAFLTIVFVSEKC